MKKNQKSKIKNQKFLLKIHSFTVLLLITCYLLPVIAFAKDSTPSATPTATSSASLQSKLKALQDEIASKAAKLKQEVSKNLQNKAYIGLFNPSSDDLFKIKTGTSIKSVSVNEFTQYSSLVKLTSKGLPAGRQDKLDLKSFVASDSVAALGDIDDNGVLTAKKVIKLAPLQFKEKQLILGSVSEISNQAITIKDKLDKIFTVRLTANTDYRQGQNDSSLNSIKVNQTVIALVDKSSESTLSARLIYSYPTAGIFKTKPASPSAAQASPSGKIKR